MTPTKADEDAARPYTEEDLRLDARDWTLANVPGIDPVWLDTTTAGVKTLHWIGLARAHARQSEREACERIVEDVREHETMVCTSVNTWRYCCDEILRRLRERGEWGRSR